MKKLNVFMMLLVSAFVLSAQEYGMLPAPKNNDLYNSNVELYNNYCNVMDNYIVHDDIENALATIDVIVTEYYSFVDKKNLLLKMNDMYDMLLSSNNNELLNKWSIMYNKVRKI